MDLDVENIDDFYQYYAGQYIKGRDGNIYYCISDSTQLKHAGALYFQRSEDKKWVKCRLEWRDFPKYLMFGLPRIGICSVGKELLYLSYEPSRAGNRALYLDRVRTWSHNADELEDHKIPTFSIEQLRGLSKTPKLVRSIIFPIYFSLAKALRAIKEDDNTRVAFPLDPTNKRFGLFQSIYHEHPQLTYRQSKVASVIDDKIVLSSENRLLLPVVKESFPDFHVF